MSTTARSDGAVVIGRDYGALAVVRSLGRHGIPVVLLEERRTNAGVSRHVTTRRHWPSNPDEQLAMLRGLDKTGDYRGWTLFPASDESAALIARHHDELSDGFRLTTPPWETYRLAYDKRLSYQLAGELGVAHPATACPSNQDDLLAIDWQYPVILKPAVKPNANALTAAKAWRADSREELLARYAEAAALGEADAIMIQELVPGGGETQFSYVALCDEGIPLAWGVARRTRQYPLDFGKFSTFVETVDCPEIEEPSRRLLAAMRYSGVVEIEYKRDPRNGAPKLLDINARYWAWHSLGRRTGVDFPYMQWRAAHGETFPEMKMRTGGRWVRGLTDVMAATLAMRAGLLTPTRYLSSVQPALECAIFAFDDPMPFLADIPLMALRHVTG